MLWEEHFLYIMYAVHGYTAVTWSASFVCDNGEHHEMLSLYLVITGKYIHV